MRRRLEQSAGSRQLLSSWGGHRRSSLTEKQFSSPSSCSAPTIRAKHGIPGITASRTRKQYSRAWFRLRYPTLRPSICTATALRSRAVSVPAARVATHSCAPRGLPADEHDVSEGILIERLAGDLEPVGMIAGEERDALGGYAHRDAEQPPQDPHASCGSQPADRAQGQRVTTCP